jgi:hypothetical protein
MGERGVERQAQAIGQDRGVHGAYSCKPAVLRARAHEWDTSKDAQPRP